MILKEIQVRNFVNGGINGKQNYSNGERYLAIKKNAHQKTNTGFF